MVSFLKDFGILIPPQFTSAAGTTLVNIPDVGWRELTATLTSQYAAKGMELATMSHITAIMSISCDAYNIFITCLLVVGIKESAGFNSIMVIVKVGGPRISASGFAHCVYGGLGPAGARGERALRRAGPRQGDNHDAAGRPAAPRVRLRRALER